ncbi:MAG: GNAT family N-acetyltransferase [Deltaproteobacteria bacterium]|nr:GNAT family N-acetyltransferase [Deltaproteobacteria bacterium]
MPRQRTKVVLTTRRLLLREMDLDGLDFVAVMLADPEVMRFYPKCYSRPEAEIWLRRQLQRYAEHGHGLWLVLDQASGVPLGQVGLTVQHLDGVDEPEVGYLIHRPFWRQGFATEAAIATRDYAFDALARPRVISLVRPENVPSQGVARKMGMAVVKRTVHAALVHLVFAVERNSAARCR